MECSKSGTNRKIYSNIDLPYEISQIKSNLKPKKKNKTNKTMKAQILYEKENNKYREDESKRLKKDNRKD